MSEEHTHNIDVPKPVLYAAGLLILIMISIATFSKQTGIGRTEVIFAEIIEHRDLFFEDLANGDIHVMDANDNSTITTLHTGEGAFIRGVMRGLVRERRSYQSGPEIPFELCKHADGRYSINDPVTKRRIDLNPFGESNIEMFSKLLQSDVQYSDDTVSMH